MTLKVNDTILYGAEGVCKIVGKTHKDVSGEKIEYFVLEPLGDENLVIYAPVNNKQVNNKMRHILSPGEIYALIEDISGEKTEWIENDSKRRDEYRKLISNGTRLDHIRMIKTLYLEEQARKELGRKLHVNDERLMKSAEKILYEEFAHVLDINPDQVLPFILKQISLNEKA